MQTNSFGDLTPVQVAELEERLQRRPDRGLVFRNIDWPQGCSPAIGDIRLEAASPAGVRLVCTPFAYAGQDDELAAWSVQPLKHFADVASAHNWLRIRYGHAPAAISLNAQGNGSGDNRRDPASLTNLDAISLPPSLAASGCRIPLEELIDTLTRSVVGQHCAVTQVARLAVTHLAQTTPVSPAVGMLVGPTGTGKTSLVTALSEAVDLPLVRIDLSEYAETHRVSSLLGAPPGYVGHGDPSPLIETLTNTPRCIVLFDEWEKAHASIARTLLTFLDTGRITSGAGRTVEAPDAVVLLTSNLGAEQLAARLDAADGWDSPDVVARVTGTLLRELGIPPDQLGRVDCFAAFRPLPPTVLATLSVLALQRLATCYSMDLCWVDPAVATRVLAARDPRAGSRGLQRAARHIAGITLADCQLPAGSRISLVVRDGEVCAIPPDESAESNAAEAPTDGNPS